MNEHLEAYKRVFPAASLTIFQQEMIEMRIEDAGAWNETLTAWAGNAWRAQSVFKMCQYYDEIVKNGTHNNINQKPSATETYRGYNDFIGKYPTEAELASRRESDSDGKRPN